MTLREVASRKLVKQVGAAPVTYTFDYDPGASFHGKGRVRDPNGISMKQWIFETDPALSSYGLATFLQDWLLPAVTPVRSQEYAWTADSRGNRYISWTEVLINPEKPAPEQKRLRSGQVVDIYGITSVRLT